MTASPRRSRLVRLDTSSSKSASAVCRSSCCCCSLRYLNRAASRRLRTARTTSGCGLGSRLRTATFAGCTGRASIAPSDCSSPCRSPWLESLMGGVRDSVASSLAAADAPSLVDGTTHVVAVVAAADVADAAGVFVSAPSGSTAVPA